MTGDAEGDGSDSEASPSPWSRGSNAVFASPGPPIRDIEHTEHTEHRPAVDGVAPKRRVVPTRTVVVLIAAACLLGIIAVGRSLLVTDSSGDVGSEAVGSFRSSVDENAPPSPEPVEPLVAERFAGADVRRLPQQLEQRWRADVADVTVVGGTGVSVLTSGAVVGVFGGDRNLPESSVIALLDGEDGSVRWRTAFDVDPSTLEVLVDVGDVVVIERRDVANRVAIALRVDSGEVAWQRDVDEPGAYTALRGTPLIVHVPHARGEALTFIDPATGTSVGQASGRLVATDHLGTWYLRNGAVLSELDLRNGWSAQLIVGTLWNDDGEPAIVVGEQLVALDDGILEMRVDGGAPGPVATVGAGSGGFAGLDTGANFTSLLPLVGDAFVLVGPRSVFGARLDENGDADVRWRASGTPIDSHPTERGLSLILASEGGAAQRVIDASTGQEIATITIVEGSIDALRLVGNGIVLKRTALVGFERVGLDLDGNRLWSLVGDGPLAIGSGVVVTAASSDAGVAITAFGDPAG